MNLMPFGRFKGQRIDAQKTDYMSWLLQQSYIRDPLKTALEEELARREKSNQNGHGNGQAAPSSCPSPKLAAEIIGAGLRALTQLGPDEKKMAELNRAASWLRDRARGGR